MIKSSKIWIIGGMVLLSQFIVFRDHLSPIHWGEIKVRGLACTCPDQRVVNGQLYLRYITPDSLKDFNLDYSEISVPYKPSTEIDPMGSDLYFVKGQLIGKDRVSDRSRWNPVFRIDSWRPCGNVLIDLAIKALILFELLVIGIMLKLARNLE